MPKSISEEEILNEIKRVSIKIAPERLTQEKFNKYSKNYIKVSLLRSRYTTFNNAVKLAGLKPAKEMGISKDVILAEIFSLAQKLQRRPTVAEFCKGTGYSKVILKKVGGMAGAIEILRKDIHFNPESINEKKISRKTSERLEKKKEKHKVFVVHGHDVGMRIHMENVLLKLGLNPVIILDQNDLGKTITQKFEDNTDVSFAVVLLSEDDISEGKKRPRQNVMFEWGYFIGKIGRSNTFVLKKGDLEIPTDISNIGCQSYKDESDNNWIFFLIKDLNAANIPVDAKNL